MRRFISSKAFLVLALVGLLAVVFYEGIEIIWMRSHTRNLRAMVIDLENENATLKEELERAHSGNQLYKP